MQSKEKLREAPKEGSSRRTIIANFIMLFALLVCIILVILAWFLTNDIGGLKGMNFISIDKINVTFSTYVGKVDENGNVIYDETNDICDTANPEVSVSLYPGQKQYYKTIIYNGDTKTYKGAFCLESLKVNKNFSTYYVKNDNGTTSTQAYLHFTSKIEGDDATKQSYDLDRDSGIIDNTFCNVSAQNIYTNLSLDAGEKDVDGATVPSSVTVIWSVELDGDKVTNFDADGNSVMDTELMKFSSIRFRQE